MQAVDQSHLQFSSLEAVQIQTNEINRRFSNLESLLERSFQNILSILSQQKSQMDHMSIDLGKFKQDSLKMSQQIKSLLFSKKGKTVEEDFERSSHQLVADVNTKHFSNGFQLGESLNQIKFLGNGVLNPSIKIEKKKFLEEDLEFKENSISESSILRRGFEEKIKIDFEPLESKSISNRRDLSKGTLRERGRSGAGVYRQSLRRFETPQGKRELQQRKSKRSLYPPKLKKRSSLISKKNFSGNRFGQNIKNQIMGRKQKQMMRKANLNLLSDKLGQLQFGNEDLKSRDSSFFENQSHFLDKISRDHSTSSKNRTGKFGETQNSQCVLSLGIFNHKDSQDSNQIVFNFPKQNIDSKINSSKIQEKNKEGQIINSRKSVKDFSGNSINIPSLKLDSSYNPSLKQEEVEESKVQSRRTIDLKSSRNRLGSRPNFNVPLIRTPSLDVNGNISIFSINRKQANMKSINKKREVPVLPVLQSSAGKKEDRGAFPKTHIPSFNPNVRFFEESSNLKGTGLIEPKIARQGENRKGFVIRDPLVGEKTPSTINHSKLQRNLNAIQFDFSYNTGKETKESIPNLANFESYNSSHFNQSNFDITPLLPSTVERGVDRLRNWSINPNPNSAYLEKVRADFPGIKNGLKINEYGQMSIDDSTFSHKVNVPSLHIQTVRSSNGKLQLNEMIEEVEEFKAKGKKGDFSAEEAENKSVRTAHHLPSQKDLPEFEYSEGFDASMFSADFDSKDSRLTCKKDQEDPSSQFNLQEELRKLPTHDFFGMDLQVPGIQNQTNVSQFNMSLLEQLDFKEDVIGEGLGKSDPFTFKGQSLQFPPKLQEEKSDDLELILENEGFELTLKELKTQLDAAHYQMFDSKFDSKFEELTRKLREYWLLDRDVGRIEAILKSGDVSKREELDRILLKRKVESNHPEEWNEQLREVKMTMNTGLFEDALRKLMRDPSGFNSFLILVKKRLVEQETLFKNSF